MTDFLEAFQPLYTLAKRMTQSRNYVFSEFYMQWLVTIKELRRSVRFGNNPLLKVLTESCARQVADLRQQVELTAGLLLDPRFNYIESVVFSGEQRDELKVSESML